MLYYALTYKHDRLYLQEAVTTIINSGVDSSQLWKPLRAAKGAGLFDENKLVSSTFLAQPNTYPTADQRYRRLWQQKLLETRRERWQSAVYSLHYLPVDNLYRSFRRHHCCADCRATLKWTEDVKARVLTLKSARELATFNRTLPGGNEDYDYFPIEELEDIMKRLPTRLE